MSVDDVAGDRKAEAGAACFAGTTGIHAIKAFEYALLIGERDADACVRDAEDGLAVPDVSANANVSACAGVLNRVIEKILEHFAQKRGIAAHCGKAGRDFDLQSNLLAAGLEQRGFGAGLDKFGDADGAKFQFEFAGFDARQFQKIVGEPGETGGVFTDDLEEAPIILRIIDGTGEERFGKTLNRRERGFEFVRNVGNEILAHALEAAKFTDVVQHQHGARGFFGGEWAASITGIGIESPHRIGGDGKAALLNNAHSDIGAESFFAFQGATNQSQKIGVAEDLDDGPALDRGVIEVQDV